MRYLKYALLGLLGLLALAGSASTGRGTTVPAVAQAQGDIVVEAVINCIDGPPITCEQDPLAGEYGVTIAPQLYDKLIRVSLAPGATSATFDLFWECSRDVTDADLDGFNDCRTVEPKPNHPKDHTDLQHVDHRLRDYAISIISSPQCMNSPSPGVPVRAEFDGEIMGSGFVDTASPDCFYFVKLLAPPCTDAYNPDTDPFGAVVTADCHHVDRLGSGRPQDVDIFADLGDRFVARSAAGGEGGVDLIARTAQDLAITPVVCQAGFTQCQEDPTGGDFGTLNPGQPATKVIEVTLRPYFLEGGLWFDVTLDLLWECARDVTDADADGFNDCRDISPGSPNHPKDINHPMHIDGHLRDAVAISSPDQGRCLDYGPDPNPSNMPAEVEVELIGSGEIDLIVPICFYELSFTAPACSGGCTLGDDIVVQWTGHSIPPEPSTPTRLQIDPIPTTNEDFGCAGSVIAVNLAAGVSVPSPGDNPVQCFVSTPPRPAILLIPGVSGDCGGMNQLKNWLETTKGLSGRVECFDASDPRCYGTEVSAHQLQAKVLDFRLLMGVDKVYLVGYSYGGILARWYIEELSGGVNVQALVMVGTPNHGVEGADRISSFFKRCQLLFKAQNRVFEELEPGSEILKALNDDWTGPPLTYWTIAGTADDALFIGIPFLGDPPNDCLVKVSEVALTGVIIETVPDRHKAGAPCWLVSATPLMEDEPNVYPKIWNGLGLTGSGASAPSSTLVSDIVSVAQAAGPSDLRPLAGAFTGSLSPASADSRQVSIDSEVVEGIFVLGWIEGPGIPSMQLTLRRPDGTIVQATDAGVEHSLSQSPTPDGVAGEEWRVQSPSPGTWTLEMTAGAGSVDVDYTLLVPLATDVTFTLDTDQVGYLVGATGQLTAAVSQAGTALAGATVLADVLKPDGLTDALTLFDDGAHGDGAVSDGVYGNDLLLGQCGIYSIKASADVVLAGAIHRETTISLMVIVQGDSALDPCLADEDNDSSNGATVLTQTPGAAATACPGGSVPIWADCVESYLGTVIDDNCALGPGPGGDAWPPDISQNGTVSGSDATAIFPVWLLTDQDVGWDPRFDLTANGAISGGDVTRIFPLWLVSCT